MESIAAGPERSRATVTTVVRKMGERLMVDVGPEIEGQYMTMKELAMILPVLLLALQAHERMLQQAVASRDLLLMQERTLKSLLELCCEDEQRIEQEERLCEEEQKRLQEREEIARGMGELERARSAAFRSAGARTGDSPLGRHGPVARCGAPRGPPDGCGHVRGTDHEHA